MMRAGDWLLGVTLVALSIVCVGFIMDSREKDKELAELRQQNRMQAKIIESLIERDSNQTVIVVR